VNNINKQKYLQSENKTKNLRDTYFSQNTHKWLKWVSRWILLYF